MKSENSEGEENNKLADDINDEEVAQNENLVFNRVDTNTEKIIFYLFTVFFLFIVFTQMGISKSFLVNDAIKKALSENDQTFTSVQTLNEFQNAYTQLMDLVYEEFHYDNAYAKIDDEKYALDNFNYVVSNMRITQRRIQTEENKSEISKRYIAEVWAGYGISYDDKKQSFEYTDFYGPVGSGDEHVVAAFTFNKSLSYEGNAGYVININVYENTRNESFEIIDEVMSENWLDDKTAALIIDFIVYNPYLEILMYTKITCKVEPSGRLNIKIYTDALKRSYYSGSLAIFRAICECLFLVICFFYIFRKLYEIYQEYLEIQNQFQKAEKKKKIQNEEAKKKLEEEQLR
jgi:hypothetical protein